MEIQITKRFPLPLIPSASGVEYIAPHFYIIGDDARWLFKLDAQLSLVSKTEIFLRPDGNDDDIIPKSIKPDFEAMTIINLGDKKEFYLFGSGSKSPTRDILVTANIETPEKYTTQSLVEFYSLLKKQCNLTDAELNIEGAFSDNKNIYLLNRGKNLIIWFAINSFNNFLSDKNTVLDLAFHAYALPSIKNVQAGFSGATFIKKFDLILFTASIENTDNWIDDGEVLGSYVGVLFLKDLVKITTPITIPITENGQPIPIKIESLAVKTISKKIISLVLVTDSDGGTSELIDASLLLN